MLGVRLSKNLETRLALLSEKTGRTKTYYVKKALEKYLEDQDDLQIAFDVLKDPDGYLTLEEMKKKLGL